MAEDIPEKNAYAAVVLIRGDARNTRPPYDEAYTDQILYLMTSVDEDFKGFGNPKRKVSDPKHDLEKRFDLIMLRALVSKTQIGKIAW